MRPLAPQLSHLDPNMTPTGSPRTSKNQQKQIVFLMFFIVVHLGPLGTLWTSSWSILDAFGVPLVPLGCFLGSPRELLGSPWAPLGLILGHLGPILTHLGLTLGSSWPLLAPSCSSMAPLVLIYLQFGCPRVPFGSLLAPFWTLLDHFGTIWGSSWDHFGIKLVPCGHHVVVICWHSF